MTARNRESGAAALIMVAFVVIMTTLAAYVIDLGLARQIRREAQNAADAAALAGAGSLWTGSGTVDFAASVAAVKNYAARNFDTASGDWDSCSAPVPSGFTSSPSGTTCITYDSESTPSRIHVVLPTRIAPTLFGAAAGVTDIEVSAAAEAALTDSERPICALCVEEEVDVGDGRIRVVGGGSINAGSVTGSGGEVRVDDGGSILLRAPAAGSVTFRPAPTVDPALPPRDQYAAAALPPIPADGALPAVPDEAARTAGVTCGGGPDDDVTGLTPGVWGDVTVTSGTCAMADGLYVITGTMSVSGGFTKLAGAGVTLFFVCGKASAPVGCSPGEAGGALDVDNGAALSIASPAGYPWAVVYDRSNTASLALASVDSASVTGSIYAASGVLVLNSGDTFLVNNGSVVVRGLVETGNSSRLEIRDTDLPTVFRQPDFALDQLSS